MIKLRNVSEEYIFTKIIDDEEMNTRMIARIDEIGDEAFRKTNVKADCTSGNLHHQYPEFNSLSHIIEDFCKESSYEMQMDWENHQFRANSLDWNNAYIQSQYCNMMWGTRYESGEITTPHDHWPTTWAFCYYIDPPENCSGLIFPTLDYELKIEHGMLVIFRSHLIHETTQKSFEGNRYCVVGTVVSNPPQKAL